ncbi:MAG TPA: hypothetical protein PLA74_06745 [Syntrophales bacterium]|nr:hypothetical protein [Syntrophales bacterium]
MEVSPPMRVVGGQCEYKKYEGRATIVSIHRKEQPDSYHGPAYEQYEVRFTYHSDEAIREEYARIDARESLLLLKNSWNPGPRFLGKYGIEEGVSFDCYLKVIIRGACTPLIFDFPTIDLGDYFENQY